MSRRLSLNEAQSLGLISKDKAKSLKNQLVEDKKQLTKRLSNAKGIGAKASPRSDSTVEDNPNHPQYKLFKAIEELEPGIAIYEAKGFIEDRKFRLDIFLPESMLVIEMDGFAYHRSKSAFQSDRDRQLILVEHGCTLINVYNAQVQSDVYSLAERIVATHYQRKEVWESTVDSGLVSHITSRRKVFIDQLTPMDVPQGGF